MSVFGLSIITLGVADLARSRAFYGDVLGLVPSGASEGDITFYQLPGVILALYPRKLLAEDATVPTDGSGFRGFTMACNLDSPQAVDDMLAQVAAGGGRIVKPAHTVFWGGYSGYFADPDDHLWEVAHNPFGNFDARGIFRAGPQPS